MKKIDYSKEINTGISVLLSEIKEDKIYSNLIEDLFTKGIQKLSASISSFDILPKLTEKQIQKNFSKNIKKIFSKIKTIIKSPNLDIYRILSCIYGSFLGDAIGAFCEFEEPNKQNSKNIFKLEKTVIGGVPGQITDDSEMALSLAYAIMDNPMKKEIIVDYIYFYYGAWFKTDPLDMGNTTGNALELFDFIQFHPNLKNFNTIETIISEKNNNSLSNGFLMRKSPLIAWLYYRFNTEIKNAFTGENNKNDIFDLYKIIKDSSSPDNKCTNPNLLTNAASAIYCLMALMAIKGLKANQIIIDISNLCEDTNFINNSDGEKEISEKILYYINMFKSPEFDLWNNFGDKDNKECVYHNMGYYLHAIKLTLYYLINFDKIAQNNIKKKYREIMNQICDLGGDTDTNSCIVGGVLGPLIGMANFGSELNKMYELVPPNRFIYSPAFILIYVIYLMKSNEDDNLIQNNKYFLQQILTMLYGDIDLKY